MSSVPKSVRTATVYGAVAGVSLLALAALNVAADRLPFRGLHALRQYLTNAS